MYICGLLGNNINYSSSPKIHNEYYNKNNIPLKYKIFNEKEENLLTFIKNIRNYDIVGFNVTIPFKEKIMEYLNFLDESALKVEAVNTVCVEKNKLVGYNTDYVGFIKSLEGISLKNKKALIIGDGGAAKCIYVALKNLDVDEISFCSRNYKKVEKKFKDFKEYIYIYSEVDCTKYDIIINCTPLGGPNLIGETPIKLKNNNENLLLYDLNYKPEETAFLLEGKKCMAKVMNGRKMLEIQAMESINLWIKNIKTK